MKRNFNFKRRLSMSLLLSTVILFSQCQKDANEEFAPGIDAMPSNTISATTTTGSTAIAFDVSNCVSDGGFAYVISKDFGTPSDSQSGPTTSILKVYENGVELSPAHSAHADIRNIGKGRYSHWGTKLYFSASDNSNPRTNGRKYTYSVGSLTTSITETPIALDVTSATSDGGYAFRLSKDFGTTSDSGTEPTASKVRIFENGVEIGPAHSAHNDIRNLGKGRFSHWGSKLYFSASDNSDPRTNGRKYGYLIGTSSGTTAPTAPTAPTSPTPTSPTTSTSKIIGFAMVNGSTTGGQGGQTVTVNSLSALKSAAESSSPMIIKVSGSISGTGYISVKSNKSIIGVSGATITGVSLHLENVSNVIIQNLKIRNVVGDDCINIKYSHHIWIDHNELSSDRTHGWEYWDGLLDITRESNYVTVSWNILRDSHMASLVGAGIGGSSLNDVGKLKITYHNNFFYNLSERAPDMKYGEVHMFNNYHLNNSGYSIAALATGTVRTDNNYFSNCNRPITTTYGGYQAGYISGANTNIFDKCGANNITTSASSWVPTYEYKSLLIPAANVPSVVQNGAGAKL